MERYRERKKNLRLVFSCDASFIKVQDTRVVPALKAVMLFQLLMPCRHHRHHLWTKYMGCFAFR